MSAWIPTVPTLHIVPVAVSYQCFIAMKHGSSELAGPLQLLRFVSLQARSGSVTA